MTIGHFFHKIAFTSFRAVPNGGGSLAKKENQVIHASCDSSSNRTSLPSKKRRDPKARRGYCHSYSNTNTGPTACTDRDSRQLV